MAAAFDDEDLSLSITPSNPRRNSKDDRKSDMPPPSSAPHRPPKSSSSSSSSSSTMSDGARRLRQYEIIKTLGEGSFGKVKLASHKITGQKVAMKVITRVKMSGRDMVGRIEREISYLQLLRHPHIIKLFTVIATSKEIVMVLEFAGHELFDYIVQHGRLREDKARRFFQQIICAVEYCHRHKIVHRDLKPENLLLDDEYNVKIADFGLSNIMTDGNFLKTSCGSPNYAAPEVISGKLYAGPEVDVWSCGVILYVLLTGRLPFDDEYIPQLFKKIQQGNYHVPNYISKDAAKLIRRMLQVNPVMRITVQEIRQDPWFNKDLASYLQPPVEDFVETGVDPSRAIDPLRISAGVPTAVQEKLHEQVVDKLKLSMGYGMDDVAEALGRDEPSAVKDAYLIVRENTVMANNPLLKDNPAMKPFLAQSPPTYGSSMKGSVSGSTAAPRKQSPSGPPSSNFDHPRHGSTASSNIEGRSPTSTIGILPSSLPNFHAVFMRGDGANAKDAGGETVTDDHSASSGTQTEDQKAATKRNLNPHAKGSQLNLQRLDKPEAMTPIASTAEGAPAPKPRRKTTRWQFGIRSRNSPSEAMLAIYKALKNMGAVWEKPRIRRPGGDESSPSRSERTPRGHQGSQSPEYSDSDPDAGTDPEYADQDERERRRHRRRRRGHAQDQDEGAFRTGAGSSDSGGDEKINESRRREHRRRRARGREKFGPWNDYGYAFPEDPWIIMARFRKDGMYPPGSGGRGGGTSASSSRADLNDNQGRRRSSTMGSQASPGPSVNASTTQASSGEGSGENAAAAGRPGTSTTDTLRREGSLRRETADTSVWVYVTIQLYCIEKDSYMVDFKCAGYERLVKKVVEQVGKEMDGVDNAGAVGTTEEGGAGAAATAAAAAGQDDGARGKTLTTKKEDGSDVPPRGEVEVEAERKAEAELDQGFVGVGRVVGEKDISSPFPFMDVASSLIVSLAQGE